MRAFIGILSAVVLVSCAGKEAPPVKARESAAVAMCEEHGVPEAECGICHPELLAKKPGDGAVKVRLPSPGSADEAGIRAEPAAVDAVRDGFECVAELTFDQNKVAVITPLAGGVVRAIHVDLGSRVGRGEVLAELLSSEVAEAQRDYLTARADVDLRAREFDRQRRLREERVVSDKDVQEAEAAFKDASAASRQALHRLRLLGLDDAGIAALAAEGETPGALEVRAPFAGEIVERTVVLGAAVETERPLFTLADTRVLWAMVSIPETQLPRARVGQLVALTVESLPGETFHGRLTWVSAEVDGRTRMARGRVEVGNADRRLKAHMFARARIATADRDRAVVIPRSALQSVSGTPTVFVRRSPDLYEVRPVRLGATDGDRVEIVAGVAEGEPVAVAGTFALKSQLLISRLGAGCTD